MNTFSKTIIGAFGVVALLGFSACSADDAANDALKDAGIDANVSTDGDLPEGFPSDVVTPDLPLESGAATFGNYTLRYTSEDAASEAEAYHAALEADGFTVTPIIDNLAAASAGGNASFTATSTEWTVAVSVFAPDAPGGGNYMAVVVTPI